MPDEITNHAISEEKLKEVHNELALLRGQLMTVMSAARNNQDFELAEKMGAAIMSIAKARSALPFLLDDIPF